MRRMRLAAILFDFDYALLDSLPERLTHSLP